MKRRHVPMRTCIGCLKRRPKDQLLRLAWRDGRIVVGDGEGRGLYLCRSAACLDKIWRGRGVKRVLGRNLTDSEAAALRRQLSGENDLDGGCNTGVICSDSTGGGLIA